MRDAGTPKAGPWEVERGGETFHSCRVGLPPMGLLIVWRDKRAQQVLPPAAHTSRLVSVMLDS